MSARIERFKMSVAYWSSELRGRHYWTVSVSGVQIKLAFSTPLHHYIAKIESIGQAEMSLMQFWMTLSGRIIYDIGGYNGIYGLLAAKKNPDATVTIFEPDAINAAHVRKNIALNELENCHCIEAAVSNTEGSIGFSQNGRTKERMTDDGPQVQCVSLASLPPADLIKIDVEGAEGLVFEGLTYTPTILLELHHESYITRYGYTRESVLDIARAKGLKISLVEDRGSEQHYLFKPA